MRFGAVPFRAVSPTGLFVAAKHFHGGPSDRAEAVPHGVEAKLTPWRAMHPIALQMKRAAVSAHRSERTEPWLKIKTVQKGNSKRRPALQLYLGKREGKATRLYGKVGTGWTRTISSQIVST